MVDAPSSLVTERFDYDGGRDVTLYVPSGRVETFVFAADGGWHVERLGEALAESDLRTTMVVGLHGHPEEQGRLREYVPTVDPTTFLAHEQFFVAVVDWVGNRYPMSLDPDRCAVWGASLGGEFALAMGLRMWPRFRFVFSVSPGAGFRPPAQMGDYPKSVYLVAGTEEPFFLANARRWSDSLTAAGSDVVMMERAGGHGDPFSSAEFPRMVNHAWPSQLPRLRSS